MYRSVQLRLVSGYLKGGIHAALITWRLPPVCEEIHPRVATRRQVPHDSVLDEAVRLVGSSVTASLSVTSLFNSPAADITLDQVRELVSQNLPESLTLEYKETCPFEDRPPDTLAGAAV